MTLNQRRRADSLLFDAYSLRNRRKRPMPISKAIETIAKRRRTPHAIRNIALFLAELELQRKQ